MQMIKNIGLQRLQECRAISRLTLLIYKLLYGHVTNTSFTRLLSKECATKRTNSQNCFRTLEQTKTAMYKSPRTIPEWNSYPRQA